jgi:hypothetical protein
MNYYLTLDKNGFIIGVTYSDIPPQDGAVIASSAPPLTVGKFKTRYVNEEYVSDGEPWVEITYAHHRKMAYPPIGDQLDMLWHAMNNGLIPKIEPMYSQIKAVKEANPKPSA